MKSLTTIDYTRTCDECRVYIPPTERLNDVAVTRWDDSPGLGWYRFQDTFINHLCDKCYFAARLEGKV